MTKKKKPEELLKRGAPPFPYTTELAHKICHTISTTSKGLETLCKENADFPSHTVIYEWKLYKPDFAELYAQAKRNQADFLIEEIVQISDDAMLDTIMGQDGVERPNTARIQRARLMCDTRKWIASKMIPKVYGDRVQNDTTVTVIRHEDALKELE